MATATTTTATTTTTTTTTTVSPISATTATYCYLDLDINENRRKLALTAAFVNATDTRYGLSSSDLRLLGGSEVARLPDLLLQDHEWYRKIIHSSFAGNGKDNDDTGAGAVVTRPPPTPSGNRIIFKLDWDTAPLACENFATLCSNGGGDRSFWLPSVEKKKPPPPAPISNESGKPLTYRQSQIHRVKRGFVIQGGDFVFGNGSGGESIFKGGKAFKDEKAGLQKKHDRRGLLSMGNKGKNSNTSQFFVTLAATPQCDGKHVIFGRVVSGMDVLDAVEALARPPSASRAEDDETPTHSIVITDCGVWTPLWTPAAGYWYDKPDPSQSFTGISSLFMVRPRVAIVAPNDAAADKFSQVLQPATAATATTSSSCTVVVVASRVMQPQSESNSVTSLLSSSSWVDPIRDLLNDFAVDVILVAPACSPAVLQHLTALPDCWTQRRPDISLQEVILEAKPIEALAVIWQKSWLSKKTMWQLDGAAL